MTITTRPKYRTLQKIGLAAFASMAILLNAYSTKAGGAEASISYETFGTGPEHVVVLHDWLGDRSNYSPARAYFDTERFTYAFADLRGYGKSIGIAGKHTADEAAVDVVSVADALGWKRFHIVGHSMTGMVVQRVVLNVPERIKTVVATSPVAASGMTLDEGTWNFFKAVVTDRKSAADALALLTGNRLSKGWIDFKVRRAMATSTAEARMNYLHMFVKHDFSAEAEKAKLAQPFLVILGANDLPAFRPDAVTKTFAKWYKNLTVVDITNAGHYAMQETPALFAATIETFMLKNIDK
jgi:pimeloyl-ACP methyl ester carboxylesterase